MRKRLILLAFVLLVVMLGLVGLSYIRSKQKLTIVFDANISGVSVALYRVTTQNDDISPEGRIDKSNPIKELTSGETMSIKKGNYVLIASGSSDYSKQVISVELGNKPQSLTINPFYTETKLEQLLAADKDKLLALIVSTFPVAANYDIGAGTLYERGEWYATTLRPKQTAEEERLGYIDVYRLVAHKESGTWKIVTIPPELIINTHNYPNIPRDILVDVNKQ